MVRTVPDHDLGDRSQAIKMHHILVPQRALGCKIHLFLSFLFFSQCLTTTRADLFLQRDGAAIMLALNLESLGAVVEEHGLLFRRREHLQVRLLSEAASRVVLQNV